MIDIKRILSIKDIFSVVEAKLFLLNPNNGLGGLVTKEMRVELVEQLRMYMRILEDGALHILEEFDWDENGKKAYTLGHPVDSDHYPKEHRELQQDIETEFIDIPSFAGGELKFTRMAKEKTDETQPTDK